VSHDGQSWSSRGGLLEAHVCKTGAGRGVVLVAQGRLGNVPTSLAHLSGGLALSELSFGKAPAVLEFSFTGRREGTIGQRFC
jgi:hypothetical protein